MAVDATAVRGTETRGAGARMCTLTLAVGSGAGRGATARLGVFVVEITVVFLVRGTGISGNPTWKDAVASSVVRGAVTQGAVAWMCVDTLVVVLEAVVVEVPVRGPLVRGTLVGRATETEETVVAAAWSLLIISAKRIKDEEQAVLVDAKSGQVCV